MNSVDSGALYLVTGGCGFIGSHLVEAIVGGGGRVRVLDNLSSGYRHNLASVEGRVEVIEGDIRDAATVGAAMKGVRYVFHEAALVSVFASVERPQDNHDINIGGTLNVLEAARHAGVKRVVLASSAAVYGNDPEQPKRETQRPQPASPYAIGKIAGEYYLGVFQQLYHVETVSLRYFNVYGPRQDPKSFYSGVISKFTDDVRAGRQPTLFGDGGQTRDFVFVADVVQANLLAMHSPAAGHGDVYNVATGRSVTLLEMVSTLAKLAGRQIEPIFKPARAGDIRASSASIEKITRELGYAPKFDLEKGLATLLHS